MNDKNVSKQKPVKFKLQQICNSANLRINRLKLAMPT